MKEWSREKKINCLWPLTRCGSDKKERKVLLICRTALQKVQRLPWEVKKIKADSIRETHFTGGKVILTLTNRVKAINVFYTWEVGNFIELPQLLGVRPSLLRHGSLLKLSLPSLTKSCLPSYPCDALNNSCSLSPCACPRAQELRFFRDPEASGPLKIEIASKYHKLKYLVFLL